MVQSQFALSWDSYKSTICDGFSSLQQNGEFVDMTLAADGHFVKVHQVLMALVSPYLKSLISSAPCQHPVIFLNNVTHKTLCLLLEYIYTGEVHVPSESLQPFVSIGQALHIKGLETIGKGKNMFKLSVKPSPVENQTDLSHQSGNKRSAASLGDGKVQINVPAAKRIFVKQEGAESIEPTTHNSSTSFVDYSDIIDDTPMNDSDDGITDDTTPNKSTPVTQDKSTSNLQFTVSIRGSLQVILNRYIYNLHSNTHRTGIRRWRCVDYRNKKCMAFVVTEGSIVLNRGNLHNHSFHDKKILTKIEKKAVYSALDDVQGYKERDDKDTENDTGEEQDFICS